MTPDEIRRLLHVAAPPAPYGVRRLARCNSIDDLARVARRRLPRAALAYLDGGGEGEHTLRRNRAAFAEIELVPRVLNDVSTIDTTTTVLGAPVPSPIALAPVGGPRLFHHEGELAVARAAGRAHLPYAISTLSSVSIERVAAEATGPLWFQLYVWGDRVVDRELVERAQAAGYQALILTADCTARSKRERELRHGLTLPTPNLTVRSLLEGALHPAWAWHFLTTDAPSFPNVGSAGGDPGGGGQDLAPLFDGSLCWDDLRWLRSTWQGPIALKGLLSPEDARRAVEEGADAVIVSNHGGRQLDHVPAAIDALPGVVEAVDDRIEVLMDSGIRRGTDIATALALGARAVLVGRAHLYGLAAAGEPGVSHAIDILTNELRLAMAMTGATSLAALRPDRVSHRAVPARP